MIFLTLTEFTIVDYQIKNKMEVRTVNGIVSVNKSKGYHQVISLAAKRKAPKDQFAIVTLYDRQL